MLGEQKKVCRGHFFPMMVLKSGGELKGVAASNSEFSIIDIEVDVGEGS